jgi:Cof subfamily protein (haloacid dehalogenase superfamily)
MADIAVIALDMDGTLLNSNHQVTEKTADAIQQARDKGIDVILVTGRHHMMALPIHHQLALTTPLICSNGAYVFDVQHQQITHGAPLLDWQWQRLLPLITSLNLDVICHFSNGIGHQPANPHISKIKLFARTLQPEHQPNFLEHSSIADLCQTHTPLWKLELSHATSAAIDLFINALPNDIAVTYDRTAPNGLEIANKGNSKGNRLAEWVAQRGLALNQVIAFGDNYNDISMFQQVGLGVAMGNATADIQQQAHFVTASNDHDGIAVALQRWVL